MSSAGDDWVWHSAGQPVFTQGHIQGIRTNNKRRKAVTLHAVIGLTATFVSIAMIVMGGLHIAPMRFRKHESGFAQIHCGILQNCGCPGEPMIPGCLIVAGCLTIMLVLGRIISELACQWCCAGKVVDMDKRRIQAGRLCRVSCLAIYDMLALIITIMSLVTGTKFVLALHERKNYSTQAPDQDTCDWLLFWFTFILLVIGWVSVWVLGCVGCSAGSAA